jgi:hypothetical protein
MTLPPFKALENNPILENLTPMDNQILNLDISTEAEVDVESD